MAEKNDRSTQTFLDRLNWKTNTGEMPDISEFQVDVYRFKFRPPMTGECMTDFTEFLQGLSLRQIHSVIQIWVWLYQHNVKFRMVFGYNPRLSLRYNIRNILQPGKINKLLLSREHDDLMSCSLEPIAQNEEGGK